MKKTLTFLLSPFNNSGIWSSRGKYQRSGAPVIRIPYSDSCSVSKGSARIPRVPFLHGSELKLAEQGFTWDLQAGVKQQPLLSEWRSSGLEVVTEVAEMWAGSSLSSLSSLCFHQFCPCYQGPRLKAHHRKPGSKPTEAAATQKHSCSQPSISFPFSVHLGGWPSLASDSAPPTPTWTAPAPTLRSSNSCSKSLIPQRTMVPLPLIDPWLIHNPSRPQLWEN